jgi:hypothetical protein
MKLKSNKKNNQSSLIDNQLEKLSTPVENVRQIDLFMQNKAKVKLAKIKLSSFLTSKYE